MDHHYSTLELANTDVTGRAPELVRYDMTARAPERDYDATAFELDASALAPQTVLDTTPQVFYNSSLPEVPSNNDGFTKERASSLHIIKPALKWPWIVMGLLVAAVIAIGIGVGIWSHRKHSSHNSSTIGSPAAPHDPKVTSSSNITRAAQYILNDTSLAAMSLANGDRHLFFQDNTGLIRNVVRTASNSQWSMSSNLGVNSNAKNYTPMAVLVGDSCNGCETQITLYYVSESHVLISNSYDSGSWVSLGDLSAGNYSTKVDTRSLSITSTGDSSDTDSLTESALLYYENPTGKVSALLQHGVGWVDITSQESKSLPDEFRNAPNGDGSKTLSEAVWENAKLSTPFTSGANWTGPGIGALFYSPINASSVNDIFSLYNMDYAISPSGPRNFSTPGNFTSFPVRDFKNTSIQQSDIAMFGSSYAIWINGTQPALINADQTPNNSFPFSRLASVTLADQSATFLYHQINGTTFAEEQWDASENAWIPSVYISVSDS